MAKAGLDKHIELAQLAGNVPCFIEKSTDIKQAVIIEECIYDEVVELLKDYNYSFLYGKEKEFINYLN
ncbi:MAG: hypothetical protein RSG52_07905 [Terrisporobacter sp.]|uniref:hypothetical protein n=1 Tax=Terrisporobacter sp. TaxID=1965305 RepID=UPI002FC5F8ED